MYLFISKDVVFNSDKVVAVVGAEDGSDPVSGRDCTVPENRTIVVMADNTRLLLRTRKEAIVKKLRELRTVQTGVKNGGR